MCSRVFLDVKAGGSPRTDAPRRVTIELFDCVTPRTAENFKTLCVGDKANQRGKVLTFKGSAFHHVVPGSVVEGGDIKSHDGTGGPALILTSL